MILQDESTSFPMLRVVNLFNSGFRCLSKFAFKYSVIQQRYGRNSRSTCFLDFKLTGIQIATKSMLGTTNGEHRKFVGVKTMSLFGYGIQFLLSGVLPIFQNLSYNLQKRLSDVLPNQRSHQVCTVRPYLLCRLRYPIIFSTTVLCTYRAGVRRGAVARLFRYD